MERENSKMNVDEEQPMPDYTNIADNRAVE